MTRDEVIDLLSLVAVNDKRTVGLKDVDLWFDLLHTLPPEVAGRALREQLREQPDVYVRPGHIWNRGRALVRDQLEREPDQVREARQAALDAKLARDDEPTGPRWTGPPKYAPSSADSPIRRRCPHCGAAPFKQCRVPGHHRPPHGGMHQARIDGEVHRWPQVNPEDLHREDTGT